MFYGKHFGSMYERSMVGAGAHVFAVMGYVIAKQQADKVHGSYVELNPKLLAAVIGEPEDKILKAIEYLSSPDDNSTTKAEGGRRIVKVDQFGYRVVNGAKYRAIRDEEERRKQNRDAQRKFRLNKSLPLIGETAHDAAVKRGASEEELNGIVTGSLPTVVAWEAKLKSEEPEKTIVLGLES